MKSTLADKAMTRILSLRKLQDAAEAMECDAEAKQAVRDNISAALWNLRRAHETLLSLSTPMGVDAEGHGRPNSEG